MRGKLIVIEGTDCSGKETQTNILMDRLKKEGYPVVKFSFPMYDTPTGKIVGGPYLGKEYICDGWFPETAPNVDPKVSSLYYAADRKYNMPMILEELESGTNVILDRYVFSNMAHQGGKIFDDKKREDMYSWLDKLEFGLLELAKPDICLFLHMPYEAATILKSGREEKADQHEANPEHLIHAEKAYIEVARRYNFKTIECANKTSGVTKDDIKTPADISEEVYNLIKGELTKTVMYEPIKEYKKQ